MMLFRKSCEFFEKFRWASNTVCQWLIFLCLSVRSRCQTRLLTPQSRRSNCYNFDCLQYLFCMKLRNCWYVAWYFLEIAVVSFEGNIVNWVFTVDLWPILSCFLSEIVVKLVYWYHNKDERIVLISTTCSICFMHV